ncbi:MAG: selenocysteine-specific translation elongation factor [Planctomycetes bacterium]|nr:selenocysteine-specific translation elongation factor [Planctomycetota bacterium]
MVRASEGSIYNVVLGTAGHIDHGKSRLVERLTGIHPDRLKEERERGLTIDLGFAPLVLSDGSKVGIVDVPGHERFVKNMVAGATGIDAVLLVVAADDGVMPQTREHLDIMQLLDLRRGLVAITKIDLVDEEFADLVEEDVRENVRGTFLEGAPVVRVSSETGEGIDRLRAMIEAVLRDTPRRSDLGVFRMPIQRVFSAPGFGTVVTGIPISGRIAIGDPIEILPAGLRGRVRGIQAYKDAVDRARAGHSTALNISDVDYKEVRRGHVAAAPDFFGASAMFEVRFRALVSLRKPVRTQTTIRFHSGTAEEIGKLVLLEGPEVAPGGTMLAQVRLDAPVAAAPGDSFIARLHSPMVTIGGGTILDRSEKRLKAGRGAVLESLERKEAAIGSPASFLRGVLEGSGPKVFRLADLAPRIGQPADATRGLLDALLAEGVAVRTRRGDGVVARAVLDRAAEDLLRAIDAYYAREPRRILVGKLVLARALGCDDDFLDELIEDLLARGAIERVRGDAVRRAGYEAPLPEAERRAKDEILRRHRENLFAPPRLDEISAGLGIPAALAADLAELLIEEGALARIREDVLLAAEAWPEAVRRVRERLAGGKTATAAEIRDLLGTSRKFVIPILEALDRAGITARRGDLRVLRSEG